ncbi:MAG: aminotransferase class V-fold PLP-dependent enzyme [Planctomycetaceae bacterium]|nr:aminotransferase class V-fold PLP-dependent enzyme [Planctomycetaceae bacterium]
MTTALKGPFLRERFPIFERWNYLCSHSLGAVPRATEDSLQTYYRQWAELGIAAWDGPWWAAVEEFGALIARVLGAEPNSVVPMQNVTRAMAGVASCFDYRERPKIVLTGLEFTTTFPLWRHQEELGAELVIVPSEDGTHVDTGALCAAIDEKTQLVLTSHAYFRSGALQDIKAVTQAAHAHGALVMVDGYQAAGAVPVDAREIGFDFYVGGCHKWLCGGPGAGYLYVRPDLIANLRPRLTGWFGLAEPFAYTPDTGTGAPHPGIHRFLGGTPNVPALYAAMEGVRTVLEVGIDSIREYSKLMTQEIVAQALKRDLCVRSPHDPDRRNGMVCLDFPQAQRLCKEMQMEGILTDWRPDCGLRISPHFYNSGEDIEGFFSTLDRLIKS